MRLPIPQFESADPTCRPGELVLFWARLKARVQNNQIPCQALLVLGPNVSSGKSAGEALTTKSQRRSAPLTYWYLLLIPLFAVLGVVEFFPLVVGVSLSLTNASGGLSVANYSLMLTDASFWLAVLVSVLYTVGSTALCLAIGLIL